MSALALLILHMSFADAVHHTRKSGGLTKNSAGQNVATRSYNALVRAPKTNFRVGDWVYCPKCFVDTPRTYPLFRFRWDRLCMKCNRDGIETILARCPPGNAEIKAAIRRVNRRKRAAASVPAGASGAARPPAPLPGATKGTRNSNGSYRAWSVGGSSMPRTTPVSDASWKKVSGEFVVTKPDTMKCPTPITVKKNPVNPFDVLATKTPRCNETTVSVLSDSHEQRCEKYNECRGKNPKKPVQAIKVIRQPKTGDWMSQMSLWSFF